MRSNTFKSAVLLVLSLSLEQGHSCFSQEHSQLDPDSCSIVFRIKHMGVHTVEGRFREANGSMVVEDNRPILIECRVTSASFDTQNRSRDATLRDTAYLNTENFPIIAFDSEEITSNTIFGMLTIKGVARTIKGPFIREENNKGEKTLRTKFEIDRTVFDHRFGSMDGLIGKQINVELTLVFGNH